MIVKQIKGKGFFGCLKYVMEKAGAVFIEGNVYAFSTIRSMAREFRLNCEANRRVTRPVYHATLSVPSEDKGKLNDLDWGDVARRFLAKMNFCADFDDPDVPKVPYIVVRHTDRDHDHVHIVAGRVRTDGTCVSDSWDYRWGEKAVRELEVEFGLSQPFKQTNRQSAHPYLVEKLEKLYGQTEDEKTEVTETLPETLPDAQPDWMTQEVEQILAFRRELKRQSKDSAQEGDQANSSAQQDNQDSLNEVRSQKSEVRSGFCNGDLSPATKTIRLEKQGFRPDSLDNSYQQSPLRTNSPNTKESPLDSSDTLENQTDSLDNSISHLKKLINQISQQVKTFPDFLTTLKDKGIEATIKLTRNKCVQGIVYQYEGERVSGTKLGAAYTFPGLRKRQGLHFDSKLHLSTIEEHNRSCQPESNSQQWPQLQRLCTGLERWLTKTHRQRFDDGDFQLERDQDWLVVNYRTLNTFFKARFDHKKQVWLPQDGWRINEQTSQLIEKKISKATSISPHPIPNVHKKR